jgi:hypothetical protein
MKKKMLQTAIVFILVLQVFIACKRNHSENMILINESDPMILIVDSFLIDIDLDGDQDIHAYWKSYSSIWRFEIKTIKSGSYIKAIFENDTINESISWDLATALTSTLSDESGRPLYLGYKIIIGDSIYYGWVLPIHIYPATAQYKQGYYIKKTAFCTVPNQPILAGQEFLFIEE